MSKPTSIYLITSPSGKRYIGITCNKLEKRWKQHSKAPSVVGRAIRKYGDDMTYQVIGECPTYKEACVEEVRLIADMGTKSPNGYNLTDGGEGVAGIKRTAEEKRKISDGNKGKTRTAEHKQRISELNKGNRHTPEVKRKMSEARKKYWKAKREERESGEYIEPIPHTKEHRRKISEAMQRYWKAKRLT